MPVARKKIFSWSFTRYNVYKQCPYKAFLKFIEKRQEPGSAALERGARIHDEIEKYLKGEKSRLPKDVKMSERVIKDAKQKVKKGVGFAEASWAFRKDWSVTTYDDWYNCWLRIKVDYHEKDGRRLIVRDWKTGKFQEYNVNEYMEQLELYAVGAFKMYDDIDEVEVYLEYVDSGLTYPAAPIIYTRKDAVKLTTKWEKTTKPMLNDTVYKATPNSKCTWCHFSKAKGGSCQY